MKQSTFILIVTSIATHGCCAMECVQQVLTPEKTYCIAQPLSKTTQDKIKQYSWNEDCPISLKDLCELIVPHWGFDECVHLGTMIVHKAIANDAINIFQELFQARFPIEKIHLVDDYKASDDASMEDNNSSAFCCRANTHRPWLCSLHSFGIAIDVNPLINPFVKPRPDGTLFVAPESGRDFIDRTQQEIGMITHAPDNVCYATFKKYGFEWGGDWDSAVRVDYQHFQKILPQIEMLKDETTDSSSYILRQLDALLALQQQKQKEADEKVA